MTRYDNYVSCYELKIMRKLPVICWASLRNYDKFISIVNKPFSGKFVEIISDAMLRTSYNIENGMLAYCYNGNIFFVLKDIYGEEETPWLNNNVQKISSFIASTLTYHFNRSLVDSIFDTSYNGLALFECVTFGVPSFGEAVNLLTLEQTKCLSSSIYMVSKFELTDKFGAEICKNILKNKNTSDRIKILKDECDVDFEADYPSSFRLGSMSYKIPVPNGEATKDKWYIDKNVPLFGKDKEFLMNILISGRDIFRAGRDIQNVK